jgi:molybdopterin biosynthesis enzyme
MTSQCFSMDRVPRLHVLEGVARIRSETRLLASEMVELDRAFSRIVAEPVAALGDVPRFACSAMDGYALRSADTARAQTAKPVALTLNPALPVGGVPAPLLPGSATPISTGAPIPAGADAVLVRERATLRGGQLFMGAPLAASSNVRHRGEDITLGTRLVGSGDRLDPERIGMLAAASICGVAVRLRPRLAYFSTGDELTALGAAAGEAPLSMSTAR